MKKRLRKKLRIGEYAKHSFEIAFLPASGLTEDTMTEFNERIYVWGHARAVQLEIALGYTTEIDGTIRTACSGLVGACGFGPSRNYVLDSDRTDVLKWSS